MSDNGFTLETLLSSISAESSSGDLIFTSLTSKNEEIRPKLDYKNIDRHIFFGDASRRFYRALTKLREEYPIGLNGSSVASLNYQDVYSVDSYIKKANPFDIWLLEEVSKNDINDTKKYSITASATNSKNETISLIHLVRDNNNVIQSPQSEILSELEERFNRYEEESILVFDNQSGTSSWIDTTTSKTFRREVVNALTSERYVNRFGTKIEKMIPEVLFYGDEDEILKTLLDCMSEIMDELKLFAEYMPYNKVISYEEYDRVPDRFIQVLAREYGINLYESARKRDIQSSFFDYSAESFSSKKVIYKLWNRILNNLNHLFKTKGTRENLESIMRLYGVDRKYIKINEYSVFNGPVKIRSNELVDIPVLYSDGTNYVSTTVDAINGSSLSFDFGSGQDFTIQARVSLTSGTQNTIIKHPLYSIDLNNEGELTFNSITTPSVTVTTPKSSISSYMSIENNFVNVSASRSGDTLSVYLTALYESNTGNNDYVYTSSATYTDASVSLESYDSLGGTVGGSTEFPANGLFNGYIHEVRSWNAALLIDDIKEHTRNFESVSIENSISAPTPVNLGNFRSHYKLKENRILDNSYNFIVNSITAGTTAIPNNFSNTDKNYRIIKNQKKLTNVYPLGLYEDNDKIRQGEEDFDYNYQKDVPYISLSFNPIDNVNNNIKNYIQDINIFNLLGKSEDHTKHKYTSGYVQRWNEISTLWNEKNSNNTYSKNAYDYTDFPSSGTYGSIYGLADINSYIKSLSYFNDSFGGLFTFSKQFLPARVNILSEGIYIEPHILERSKIRRRFGHRIEKITEYTDDSLTADGNVISLIEGSSAYNAVPSVVEQDNFELLISNKYSSSDLAYDQEVSDELAASAASTATFQGYKYKKDAIQQILDNDYKDTSDIGNLTKNSSLNYPTFSSARSGRFLPIKITPSTPFQSEVEITLDQLLISPTSSPNSAKGFIFGRVKLINNGSYFKTESNSIRFDFPSSGDGTNLFIAEVGDIDAGQGRIIKNKDTSISLPLLKDEIQFKLILSDVVSSLSAVGGDVTLDMVEDSVSGSIGIVPIKITNLFNNYGYIVRVAINSDSTKDTDFIRQLNQGGVEKLLT